MHENLVLVGCTSSTDGGGLLFREKRERVDYAVFVISDVFDH